jgi:hypothetical protein
MSFEQALKDLQAEFGKKKLLTPDEIAPHIGRSANAQAVLRSRKRFPIPKKVLGNRIVVSIYDLAHYIGDEGEAGAVEGAAPTQPAKVSRRRLPNPAPDPGRPTRRAPSLGKTLRALRRQNEDMALELEFRRALLTKLDAIDFDRVLTKNLKNRTLAQPKPNNLR